jgi:hypothetical protein
MELWSGGSVVVALGSSCGGGSGSGVKVVEELLDSGGGGGHTTDPVTGDPRLASLAPDLSARVSVGLLCTLTWIRAVCIGANLGGELSTGMISTGSSSSSSSVTATPFPPSLGLSDESSVHLDATG